MERLDAEIHRLLVFMFQEGVLDDHFMQLHQLQDEATPNFVYEVISIYFRESEKHIRTLRSMTCCGVGSRNSSSSISEGEAEEGVGEEEEEEEESTDGLYGKMGVYLNQLIGSSSSVGAQRVWNVCIAFRATAESRNLPGCMRLVEVLESEYCYLKNMLYQYFQLEQQRVLTAGVRSPLLQLPDS